MSTKRTPGRIPDAPFHAGRVAYALIGLYFGTRAFIRHHATR